MLWKYLGTWPDWRCLPLGLIPSLVLSAVVGMGDMTCHLMTYLVAILQKEQDNNQDALGGAQ